MSARSLPARPLHARPELVVFSPLPPMPTGIADYSYDLLTLLRDHYRCTAVVEDGPAALRAPEGVALLRLDDYAAAQAAHADSLHLYHIGNNPDHIYMLPVLGRRPGLIVLHDPGLHHLLDSATAALGDADGYCAAIEAEYGAPGMVLARHWREYRLRDRSMLYDMPMLRQLLGPARHIVTHSRHAAHKVLREVPDARITVAPHLHIPPPTPDPAGLRQRLGIAPGELVFLSLGFVSHIKRVDTAMRAIARIAARLPPFRYVVAGEINLKELDVGRLAGQLGLSERVLVTGYVAEADLAAMIAMAAIVINLRHPVGGETSGTLIRALGQGACVVVVDEGPFAEIPDGAAIRLGWGTNFEAELADTLLELATDPGLRQRIGAEAAGQIGRRNHPDAALAAYRAAIEEARAATDRAWLCRTRFEYPPPQHRPATGALWQRIGAVPTVRTPGAAIALCEPDDLAALRDLGHAPSQPAQGWPACASPRATDLVFLRLAPGHTMLCAVDLLGSLNRALSFGGMLVLCLPGANAHTLASRRTGAALLRAAGFRVEIGMAALPPALSQDAPTPPEMVWRAVKISEFASQTLEPA